MQVRSSALEDGRKLEKATKRRQHKIGVEVPRL
jgi:hypothetical protein